MAWMTYVLNFADMNFVVCLFGALQVELDLSILQHPPMSNILSYAS